MWTLCFLKNWKLWAYLRLLLITKVIFHWEVMSHTQDYYNIHKCEPFSSILRTLITFRVTNNNKINSNPPIIWLLIACVLDPILVFTQNLLWDPLLFLHQMEFDKTHNETQHISFFRYTKLRTKRAILKYIFSLSLKPQTVQIRKINVERWVDRWLLLIFFMWFGGYYFLELFFDWK